jgi:hypothetical protein
VTPVGQSLVVAFAIAVACIVVLAAVGLGRALVAMAKERRVPPIPWEELPGGGGARLRIRPGRRLDTFDVEVDTGPLVARIERFRLAVEELHAAWDDLPVDARGTVRIVLGDGPPPEVPVGAPSKPGT